MISAVSRRARRFLTRVFFRVTNFSLNLRPNSSRASVLFDIAQANSARSEIFRRFSIEPDVIAAVLDDYIKSISGSQYLNHSFSENNEMSGLPKTQFWSTQTDEDLINLLRTHYLQDSGWLESVTSRSPSYQGHPVPWLTYASLGFFQMYIPHNVLICEWGGGHSTQFWLERGNSVVCFESNVDWREALRLETAKLSLAEGQTLKIPEWQFGDDGFANFEELSLLEFGKDLLSFSSQEVGEEGTEFLSRLLNSVPELLETFAKAKVLVIDGPGRNLAMTCAAQVAPIDSMIVLDNSERPEYEFGKSLLCRLGWLEIPFAGLGPINPYGWTTSVFIKSLTVLNRN